MPCGARPHGRHFLHPSREVSNEGRDNLVDERPSVVKRSTMRTGWGNAMYHLMLCDEFDAQRALQIALVQEVVPSASTSIARWRSRTRSRETHRSACAR
jgi:hypothetical protein